MLEEAQSWVLAVMALFPERRDADGRFAPVVSRPNGSALALRLLAADGIHDDNDVRRELVLLSAAARRSDPVWNLARAILITARAHTAYLLPLDEAWGTAVESARLLQQRCRGWFSMAEACLTGLAHHHGEAAGVEARQSFYALHARPDSPWNLVPWQTALPERLPAPEVRAAVLEVHDAATLAAALSTATPGHVLRLAPGHYRGSFHIDTPGLTLEGGPEVFLELGAAEDLDAATPGAPLLRITAPTSLTGLTLRAGEAHGAHATLIEGAGEFLHLSDCYLEGGHAGLVWRGGFLQLRQCRFEDLEVALALESGHVSARALTLRARDLAVRIGQACSFLRLDASTTRGRLALSHQDGVEVEVRFRHLTADHGCLDFRGKSKVHLADCRLADGLLFEHGALEAEGCQLGGTSHIAHATAHFRDCHFLGSNQGNLVLGEGQHTTCLGGQMAGVESADHANVLVLGGRVRLEGVGLGPSAGHNFVASNGARLELDSVAMSGAGRDALHVEGGVALSGRGLRIRGAGGHGLVARASEVGLAEVDLADVSGTGVLVEGGQLAIVGLGLRGLPHGLHVREGARVLVRDFVAMGLGDAQVRVEGTSRLALIATGVEVRGHVSQGLLALSGARIPTSGLLVEDGRVELEAGILAPGAVVLTRSELHLRKCEADVGAFVMDDASKLQRDEPGPPSTAISPLLIAPRVEPFIAWGFSGEVPELASVARVLARRLGYFERLGLRETAQGLRVDGPLPVVARFAPALLALMRNPGALGLALAEALDLGPSSSRRSGPAQA